MEGITLETAEKYLIYKIITGSRAYGLDTETSDTDIRGVYLLPNDYLNSVNSYVPQVANESNDIVYYELNRFMELCYNNNPNILEMLFADESEILLCDEKFKTILDNREEFLTLKCKETFGGYAISQIKKARGLNKKIVNPVDVVRKSPLDFCHIFDKETGYMMLAEQFLKHHNLKQECCGLAEMPNGVQLYKLYYDYNQELKFENPDIIYECHGFKGIILEDSNDIRHSEIPKDLKPYAFLTYNRDGYIQHCRDYKEYHEWVKKRNPNRYNDNVSHNQNYDGKNLMHCLRLLNIAIDIAKNKNINLKNNDRNYMLSIKKGLVLYDDIMKTIDDKKLNLEQVYNNNKNLKPNLDINFINDLILKIRK